MYIFQWYVWQFPLQNKQSQIIIEKLTDFFEEHGCPKIIQSDKGVGKLQVQNLSLLMIETRSFNFPTL